MVVLVEIFIDFYKSERKSIANLRLAMMPFQRCSQLADWVLLQTLSTSKICLLGKQFDWKHLLCVCVSACSCLLNIKIFFFFFRQVCTQPFDNQPKINSFSLISFLIKNTWKLNSSLSSSSIQFPKTVLSTLRHVANWNVYARCCLYNCLPISTCSVFGLCDCDCVCMCVEINCKRANEVVWCVLNYSKKIPCMQTRTNERMSFTF